MPEIKVGDEVWGVTSGCFIHGRVIAEHNDPSFYTVRTEGSSTDHILFPDQIKMSPKECLPDVDFAIHYWEAVQRMIEAEEI